MNVTVSNQQEDLALDANKVSPIVEALVRFEGIEADEISINFVGKEEICRLHKEYFGDPSFTDCISFPIDAEPNGHYRLLGEVFVCPLAAIEYASRSKSDPYDETLLYLIHGFLHLAGYDDIEEEERLMMREAEKRHLENLKKLNLDLRMK